MQPVRKFRHRHRGLLSRGLAVLVLFVLAAWVMLFSWNMFAPDIFGAPEVRFREALGMALFLLAAGGVFDLAARRRRRQDAQTLDGATSATP